MIFMCVLTHSGPIAACHVAIFWLDSTSAPELMPVNLADAANDNFCAIKIKWDTELIKGSCIGAFNHPSKSLFVLSKICTVSFFWIFSEVRKARNPGHSNSWSALRDARALPASLLGPVELFHGCHVLISCDWCNLRSTVQPLDMIDLQ